MTNLNVLIDQLTEAVDKLSSVLSDMQREYSNKRRDFPTENLAYWIPDALEIIDKYRRELLTAARNLDAYGVSWAAGHFVGLKRFFADVPEAWSSYSSSLHNVYKEVFKVAGDIAFGIDHFDPSSLGAARQQLQRRRT
jgi:hypothetical protein